MTRRKVGNNSVATAQKDIQPVVAMEDTEETEASSGDNNDPMVTTTNANPVEVVTAVNDVTDGNTASGVTLDETDTLTLMIDAVEAYDNNETLSSNGGRDVSNEEARDIIDNIEHTVSEENIAEEVAGAEEEKEELWDLKVVLSANQIRMAHPTLCQSDGCNLVACCIWSSNLDPETPWYSCLDCQEDHFGGWPSTDEAEGGAGLPIKVLGDDLREAMIEKCTESDDPDMPSLPSSVGGELKENKVSGKTGYDVVNNVPNPEDDDYDGEADDGEILWELKKVFTVKELTKSKPMRCKTDDCDLLACSVWKSSDGATWYTCLDCQEK